MSTNKLASIGSRRISASGLFSQPQVVFGTVAEWGIYLLIFALPLTMLPMSDEAYGVPKVTVLRALSILIVAALALKALHTGRIAILRTPLDLPVAAFTIVALISSAQGVSWAAAIFGANVRSDGLLTFVNAVVLCYVAVSVVRDPARVKRAFYAICLSAFLVSVEGIAEYFNRSLIGHPSDFFGFRAFGTLGNPDFMGGYLVMVVPVAAGLIMMAGSRIAKAFWSIVLFATLAALFFTYTRGAWLALMFMAPFYLVLQRRVIWNNRGWFASIAACVILLGVSADLGWLQPLRNAGPAAASAPQYVTSNENASDVAVQASGSAVAEKTGRLAPAQALSSYKAGDKLKTIVNPENAGAGRLWIWRSALQSIADHPILGTGYSSVYAALTKYYTMEWLKTYPGIWVDKAHSELLEVAVNTGLVGLACYLWFLGAFALVVLRGLGRQEWLGKQLLLAVAFAWLGYLAQTTFLFGTVDIIPIFWIFTGLGIGIASQGGLKTYQWNLQIGKAARVGGYALVIAVFALLLYLSSLPLASEIYLARAGEARMRHDSRDAMVYYLKAVSLASYNQDTITKAASALSEIAAITPEGRDRRHLLDEAVLLWNRAIDGHPKYANLYLLRAETYVLYGQDHIIDAYNDYKSAVELYPLYGAALAGLSDMSHALGRRDEAIVAERRLLTISPDNVAVLVALAEDYFDSRRWQNAIDTWRRIEEIKGETSDLHYLIAEAYLADGKKDQAEPELQASLRLNPDNARALEAFKRLKNSN